MICNDLCLEACFSILDWAPEICPECMSKTHGKILSNLPFLLLHAFLDISAAPTNFQLKIKEALHIGQFQKISVHHDGRLFGIPRARGGSLNWNSEGKGGTYIWNSEGLKLLILWTLPVRK